MSPKGKTQQAQKPTAAEQRRLVAASDNGHYAELERLAREMVERYPDSGFVWKALGHGLQMQGKNSLSALQMAVRLLPDDATAHSNLGVALRTISQLDRAVASYRRALEINPDYAEAHNNLGNALQNIGQLREALDCFSRALEIKPDYAEAFDNLLFCLTHSESVDKRSLFAEHCRFGDHYETPLRARWPQLLNERDPERCVRVGFVSGDLRSHAVANFIEPVLTHLFHSERLSLSAYYNHTIEDATTERLRQHVSHWRSIAGLSDEAVAHQIRKDGIDILIDLAGHTAKNRLLTFARKPAPVQASWVGYPGTTGLRAMDYYLSDRYLLPPGQLDDQFVEALAYLPASVPFLPFAKSPAIGALPALSNGYLTFGTFNRLAKLNPSVIALWSEILRALPDAIMVFGGMPKGDYSSLIDWFGREGITRDRLRFHLRGDMASYLTLHHKIDICLDAFPYGGGTTTYHAVWMGVPTLTVAGHMTASRIGAGILGRIGLDEFIAHDAKDFVQRGVSWAGKLDVLSEIRQGMRARFSASAVGQPAVIASGLERVLRVMWKRWCAGLPAAPVSFDQEP